jgi:hypothetical protein
LDDKASDVANPKLDIRKVKVVNTATRLKVKVSSRGRRNVRLPLGAVSVFLDTEAQRAGRSTGTSWTLQ